MTEEPQDGRPGPADRRAGGASPLSRSASQPKALIPDAIEFERRVDVSPSFARLHSNPSVNYGIGAMRLWFILIGPKGAVQWQIGTNWYCKLAQEHLRSLPDRLNDAAENSLGGSRYQPQAWDLGYHAREPQYESQTAVRDECHVLGGPCYYDGSSLNAEYLIDGFLEGGDRFLWPALEEYYRHTFEEAPWPDFEGLRARIRAEDDAAHEERVNAKLGVAQAMSASGQDPKGLEAKPASAVPEGECAMTVSREAIARELAAHPDICLGRENIAINRIKQREAINRERAYRSLEANNLLVADVCLKLLDGGRK